MHKIWNVDIQQWTNKADRSLCLKWGTRKHMSTLTYRLLELALQPGGFEVAIGDIVLNSVVYAGIRVIWYMLVY